MTTPVSHKIFNTSFWLSSERCAYWETEKTLIISDLHFGKTGHFRKAGIPVPQHVYKEDLQRLVSQVQYFQPQQLVIVGDLFHSHENMELELFKKWRKDLSGLSVQLVKGNHDILHDSWYDNSEISTHSEKLKIGNFTFTHDINNYPFENDSYYFSGHIHPGISIHGAGKQSLRFPCFYFTENYCVLPAFSRFTGTYGINPKRNEKIFAIVEKSIVQLQ
ncbi:MAG: ligase-associated DNA damage response endonuclease PdeM [Bacteroidota bacterium]